MERFRNMSLKQSLFALALINLLAAMACSALVFWGCIKLNVSASYSSYVIADEYQNVHPEDPPAASDPSAVSDPPVASDLPAVSDLPVASDPPAAACQPSSDIRTTEEAGHPLSDISEVWHPLSAVLQIALPVLFFVMALLVTASLFYRLKLREPLDILMKGANRIMENDLDFSLEPVSGDELGQLCRAFEVMRESLLKNNRELWRQAEERKRLNAAFSHDLRNPVTVLKGSVKIAKQCVREKADGAELMEHLERIGTYTARVERYVETMSRVQRLEELQPEKTFREARGLEEELRKSLSFAAEESGRQLSFHSEIHADAVSLDSGMLFQIVENLVSNALRFARENVSVTLRIWSGRLEFTVRDDGAGFPAELLREGVQPFWRGSGGQSATIRQPDEIQLRQQGDHSGMGLYICSILCRKHGGSLRMKNDAGGAEVCAVLKF